MMVRGAVPLTRPSCLEEEGRRGVEEDASTPRSNSPGLESCNGEVGGHAPASQLTVFILDERIEREEDDASSLTIHSLRVSGKRGRSPGVERGSPFAQELEEEFLEEEEEGMVSEEREEEKGKIIGNFVNKKLKKVFLLGLIELINFKSIRRDILILVNKVNIKKFNGEGPHTNLGPFLHPFSLSVAVEKKGWVPFNNPCITSFSLEGKKLLEKGIEEIKEGEEENELRRKKEKVEKENFSKPFHFYFYFYFYSLENETGNGFGKIFVLEKGIRAEKKKGVYETPIGVRAFKAFFMHALKSTPSAHCPSKKLKDARHQMEGNPEANQRPISLPPKLLKENPTRLHINAGYRSTLWEELLIYLAIQLTDIDKLLVNSLKKQLVIMKVFMLRNLWMGLVNMGSIYVSMFLGLLSGLNGSNAKGPQKTNFQQVIIIN
jgi:hypothetical protein